MDFLKKPVLLDQLYMGPAVPEMNAAETPQGFRAVVIDNGPGIKDKGISRIDEPVIELQVFAGPQVLLKAFLDFKRLLSVHHVAGGIMFYRHDRFFCFKIIGAEGDEIHKIMHIFPERRFIVRAELVAADSHDLFAGKMGKQLIEPFRMDDAVPVGKCHVFPGRALDGKVAGCGRPDALGGDNLYSGELLEQLSGAVGGAVIDDYDFIVGVIEGLKGVQTFLYGALFVLYRDDNGHQRLHVHFAYSRFVILQRRSCHPAT